MKSFSISAAAALLATQASAFPAMSNKYSPFDAPTGAQKRQASPQGAGALPLTPPPFDPEAQRVSTTGAHKYVKPNKGDARGECPGLNALSNHNYLPHNGVATIQQFMDGTEAGFGMARDLSGFLAVYGAIIDGDGSSWSIEGVPHTGIAGSHHNYEADSSPLKSDLNQYGSLQRLIMSQFYELYNMQPDPATANYNLEVMREFRGKRFQESVSKNPYFFYGPFDGTMVSQAAFTFIYRFMSNKSEEAPEGILNKDVLKSFMAIRGPEDNLKWHYGEERFPDVFYKRNPSDEYSIPYFESDVLYFAQTQPEILTIGCNQGKVNTYNPISVASLTNGVTTLANLASNPVCFSLQFLETSGKALLGLSDSKMSQLQKALKPAAKSAGCGPNLIPQSSLTQLKNCPGFTNYGGPQGPVAPGAIQS